MIARFGPLALSGCLLAVMPPPSAPCDPDLCPAGYGCDEFSGDCITYCDDDTECWDGYLCAVGRCELPCDESDCRHHLACDDYTNECLDECYTNGDCAGSSKCCTVSREYDGKCDHRGWCY